MNLGRPIRRLHVARRRPVLDPPAGRLGHHEADAAVPTDLDRAPTDAAAPTDERARTDGDRDTASRRRDPQRSR